MFTCKKSRIMPNIFSRTKTYFHHVYCHLTIIPYENIFNIIVNWHVKCNIMYKQLISVFNKKSFSAQKRCFDAVAYFTHGI